MSAEPAILGRIRETLESELSPLEAARVLLQALGEWGPRVPSNVHELSEFVEGPLTRELERRVAAAKVLRILRTVEELVSNADAPTQDHEIPIEVEWPEAATTQVPVESAPVQVLVVGGGASIAERLRAALGPERVSVEVRGDRLGIERAIAAGAAIVIVDATDVPAVRPDDLAIALRAAAPTSIRVVWGADLAYGRRVVELCARDERACTGLLLADGTGPILDLVLSRRLDASRDDRG